MSEGRKFRPPMSPEERRRKMTLWLPLWVCAVFLLFGNLGVNAISGSEARWLIVAREMLRSGDWLHPTINGEPYFDKPLLTYWLIAIPSFLNDRTVTEFTGRLYSVFFALGALGGLILIARRFLNEKASVISGWLFLTAYSFGAWGRYAEADMANLSFSLLAVLIYLRYADKRSLAGYVLFFTVCGIGAHAKGLAAVAVPCLAVLADLIIYKRKLYHLNWKFAVGVLTGVAVYALPFLLAKYTTPAIPVSEQTVIAEDGTLMTSGIALAIRENVIRFFAPFDHIEPFYAYFIHLPRHLLPWTPFFILALIHAWTVRKTLSRELKWLLLTGGFIFLFFTISGSRRHYYILPVLPYCMILTGWYITETASAWNEKVKKILLWLYAWIPAFFTVMLAITLLILRKNPNMLPGPYLLVFAPILKQSAFTVTVLAGVTLFFQWRLTKFGSFAGNATPPLPVSRAVFGISILTLFIFVYLLPTLSMTRTEKHIETTIGHFLKNRGIPQDQVYFYKTTNERAVFYLDLPYRIKILKTPDELKSEKTVFLIAQNRYFQDFPGLRKVIAERILPWEKGKQKLLAKKLELRIKRR